jgi:peroxiredoxin Q/BCP
LRQDYSEFTRRSAEIIALGPDGPNAFRRYWEEEHLPFVGCADIKSAVASQYQQEVNWIKMGRMPALLIIDKEGQIRFRQYGESMSDIPENTEVLKILDEMNVAS